MKAAKASSPPKTVSRNPATGQSQPNPSGRPETSKTVARRAKGLKEEPFLEESQTSEVGGRAAKSTGEDQRIRLEFSLPDAQNVCLAGSFNDWNPERTRLARTGGGH